MRPLTRGYIHQVAFFIACGACIYLIAVSQGNRALLSNIIYSVTLIGLYAVSTFYHCRHWSRRDYLVMKSIDHAAIFALIAGTSTSLCLFGLKGELGLRVLCIIWVFALVGMLLAIFWARSPKWLRVLFYVVLGWAAIPYLPEIEASLGFTNTCFLFIGGVFYTVGALVYALKRPNPFPRYFGYHEIFHLFVVIASALHFTVIYKITT